MSDQVKNCRFPFDRLVNPSAIRSALLSPFLVVGAELFFQDLGRGEINCVDRLLCLTRFSDDPLTEAKSRYGRIVFNVKDADAIAKRVEERGSV